LAQHEVEQEMNEGARFGLHSDFQLKSWAATPAGPFSHGTKLSITQRSASIHTFSHLVNCSVILQLS
jgi:hypothetical protein